jgi:hypothetical protein
MVGTQTYREPVRRALRHPLALSRVMNLNRAVLRKIEKVANCATKARNTIHVAFFCCRSSAQFTTSM